MTPRILPLPAPVLVALAMLVVACGEPAPPEVLAGAWPGWRGPSAVGLVAGDLPTRWNERSSRIRWQAGAPGEGMSQPVASGGRIFLTTAAGSGAEQTRSLTAFDEGDGTLLWQSDLWTGPTEKVHWQFGSRAMATPVTDGRLVYSYFGTVLAATDFDGQTAWTSEIDPAYVAESRYGAASSLALTRDSVVVFRDNEDGEVTRDSWIAAFDRATGEERWRSSWRDTCCSYTTPLVLSDPEGETILVVASGRIKALAADDGAVVWTLPYPAVQAVPSPVIDGRLFIASGAVHDRLTAAFRFAPGSWRAAPEPLWTHHRAVPTLCSPVLVGGVLFQISEQGVMSALSGEDGELLWRKRLSPGPYHAALVATSTHVYALSASGLTTLVTVSREPEIDGRNQLPTDTGAFVALAASDTCLLARSRGALYCVDRTGAGRETRRQSPNASSRAENS